MSYSLYRIVAQVAWHDGTWQHSGQVPTFYVEAISKENAEAIGRDVITSAATDENQLVSIYIDSMRTGR